VATRQLLLKLTNKEEWNIIKSGLTKLIIVLVVGLFSVLLLSRYAMISFRQNNAVINANSINRSAVINARDDSTRTSHQTFEFNRIEFESTFIMSWYQHHGVSNFEFEFEYLESENSIYAVRVIISHQDGRIYSTQILDVLEINKNK